MHDSPSTVMVQWALQPTVILVQPRQQKHSSERNNIGAIFFSHYSLQSSFVDKLQHKQVFTRKVLKRDQILWWNI